MSARVRLLSGRLLLWPLPAAWMGLIFWLSAQPDLPHPDQGWLIMLWSSAAHAGVFGVLAVLWQVCLGPGRRATAAALGLTLLYALFDELHQAFVPGRTPDLLDLVCDAAGAVLALWAWHRLPIRRLLRRGA